jgi:hypothetical protein
MVSFGVLSPGVLFADLTRLWAFASLDKIGLLSLPSSECCFHVYNIALQLLYFAVTQL